MKKLILIDGNSLLNRAFYAVRPFSTSSGFPTNGIFGFLKLLLKIVEEQSPEYLAVAFDLKAPTFRHKLYSAYKGTRKPMPSELAEQVPALKKLLSSMEICMIEKEGYEADDLIGTLSSKFEDVEIFIYTGDRDSYQLVKENVSILFTKRGVTEIDLLTKENFFEKVGLEPYQIVEEKALMGDASDNIPGVKGVGPKLAMELLTKFKTAENVLSNLDSLSPSVRAKLEGQEKIVRLSKTLALIDRNVPLSTTLSDCKLSLPFPEKAQKELHALEFRSLYDSKLFQKAKAEIKEKKIEKVICSSLSLTELSEEGFLALSFESDGLHLASEGREYLFPEKRDLFKEGFFLHELSPLLSTLLSGEKKILVADRKALLHRCKELGVQALADIEDVSLMRYLLDSDQKANSAQDFCKEFSISEEFPASAIFAAYSDSSQKLQKEEASLYRDLELPLQDVLFEMEETGVRVDEGKFPELQKKYEEELSSLLERVYSLAGERFNLNSPSQLSEILFHKLGYSAKGVKKTARGYSTGADTLERLAEKYEIASLILRYREISKLSSTYVEGIRPLIRDGIVHTTYNQTATTTGRLSSANPNLQNIPVRKDDGRELRKLFIAREGNLLIDADYSQIELRLLAHFSGCKALKEAYNAEEDIHAITASQVFKMPLKSVTPLLRRRAKAVNFGIIYGISAFGLSKDLNCSTAEAQEAIDHYFASYPEVREYMEENVRRAREDGYIKTLLGRKRYFPELNSKNFQIRSFSERAARNMPLQGSAADIMKLAMIGVDRRLKQENLQAKLVLQVHDELVLDAPLSEKERAASVLKEEMEGAVSLSVPLTAEVSFGESWYDAK